MSSDSRGIAERCFCRQDSRRLPLTDRALLIAVYYLTNLMLRQVARLFGMSKSAAHRVVDHLALLLALAPVTGRHGPDAVLVVALVPVHDRTITATSKNYRFSVNMQVVVDADPGWWSRSDASSRATTTTAPPTAAPARTGHAGVRT